MIGNETSTENVGPQFGAVGHYGNLEVVSIDPSTLWATFQTRFPDGSLGGPPEKIPVWRILPNTPEDSTKFWGFLIETIIDQLRKDGRVPSEYRSFDLSTDDDATGDPALFVKLLVDAGVSPSDIKVTEWTGFANMLRDRLMDVFKIQRWPYVQLDRAVQGS